MVNKKLSDNELSAIVNNQIQNAIGGYSSELETQQADALDRYYGDPIGNEVDGRSQVVTRDLFEQVQWALASLLRVFASSGQVVKFDPETEQDTEDAKTETDYINHIFLKDNEGYLIMRDWFESALVNKNSYLKVYVNEEEEVSTEEYKGLTELQLAEVLGQEDVEVIEQEEEVEVIDGTPVILSDVKIQITGKKKKFVIENVPQEEMVISRNHNSLDLEDVPFIAHRAKKTMSDLIEMGFDKDIVSGLPNENAERYGELQIARRTYESEDIIGNEASDDSMREVVVYECYIRMDYDGDGISELRQITMAGNTILQNESVESNPFVPLSPFPQPHKHTGLGFDDLVGSIQDINSTLLRGILDNIYLTNNPEKEVVETEVNLNDLLESIPGGIKRVKQPGMIRELTVPFTASASLPILELLEGYKESRTGISKATTGLDPNVLANATKGAFMGGMERSNSLVEMIARNFAETGVKWLFKKLHALVLMNQDEERVLMINGKESTVNPLEWKKRKSMTVTVGLGTGNRDIQIQRLSVLAERQEQHILNNSPLVTPKNLYNTLSRLIEVSDLKDPSMYWLDPESEEAQRAQQNKPAPQQDPIIKQLENQIQVEKMKNETAIKKAEMDGQLKVQEMQLENQRLIAEITLKQEEADRKREADNDKLLIAMTKIESELIKNGINKHIEGSAV